MRRPIAAAFCIALAACGEEETGPSDPDFDAALIEARPYGMVVPSSYDGTPAPLVIALHGLAFIDGIAHPGADYAGPEGRSGLAELAESRGFLLAYPDAMRYEIQTVLGNLPLRAWNSSCCGALEDAAGDALATGKTVADDVAYLRAVIADVRDALEVDDARVYIQGASNGGFMAHLMGCAAADKVAAIAPFAGTFFAGDEESCAPSQGVAVLHTHGTDDDVISYEGGTFDAGVGQIDHNGAEEAVGVWLANNGCAAEATATTSFDAEADIDGSETTVTAYGNCTTGRPVELWRIEGGGHEPTLTPAYMDAIIDFLFAHPR